MLQRLIAAILFGLMVLAEAIQAYRLLHILADPAPVAERLGISYGAEILRAGTVLVLALVVTLGALLAVVGLLGRLRAPFLVGAIACALGYLLLGLYQMATGVLQLESGGVVLSGVIYLVLGALAYAMRRSLVVE
jgi:hypothetical protein